MTERGERRPSPRQPESPHPLDVLTAIEAAARRRAMFWTAMQALSYGVFAVYCPEYHPVYGPTPEEQAAHRIQPPEQAADQTTEPTKGP